MSRMQKLNAKKRSLHGQENSLTGTLVLENQIFVADAELRWLDVVERSVLTHKADSGVPKIPTTLNTDSPKATLERTDS